MIKIFVFKTRCLLIYSVISFLILVVISSVASSNVVAYDSFTYGDYYGEGNPIWRMYMDTQVDDTYDELDYWDRESHDDNTKIYNGALSDFRWKMETYGLENFVAIGHGSTTRLGDILDENMELYDHGEADGLYGKGYLGSSTANGGHCQGMTAVLCACNSYGLTTEWIGIGAYVIMTIDGTDSQGDVWEYGENVHWEVTGDNDNWRTAWEDAADWLGLEDAVLHGREISGDNVMYCNAKNDKAVGSDTYSPGFGGNTGTATFIANFPEWNDDGFVFQMNIMMDSGNEDVSIKVKLYEKNMYGNWYLNYQDTTALTLNDYSRLGDYVEQYARYGYDNWFSENSYHDLKAVVEVTNNANDIDEMEWEFRGLSE